MAVGNLEFIKSASGTSVSSLSVTDCFSADYDVYFIYCEVNNVSSSFDNVAMRYRNSSGDVSTSTYDAAHMDLDTGSTFGGAGYLNDTEIEAFQITDVTRDGTAGISYHFNPYDSSSYTFNTRQNMGSTSAEYRGRKGIGVETTAQQITGITFYSIVGSQTADFFVSVYGVK